MASNNPPVAELRLTYAWICDSCGNDNVLNSPMRQIPPPDEVDTDQTVYSLTIPKGSVVCRHCSAEYLPRFMGDPMCEDNDG